MQAQDAAELAVVEYEELPCVVDARAAIAQGAPLVWEGAGGNIAAEASYGQPEQVEKAFANAAHVTGLELHNQRVIAMAMEPRACIGVFDGARTTLYTQNQTPTGARELLGAVFKRKPEEFRVVNGDIGGGFGMKTGLTPEDALVCYAARKLGRPVRWRGERSEEFLAAHMGRDQHVQGEPRARSRRTHPRASHRGARQHRRGAGRLFGHHPAAAHAEGADHGVSRAGRALPRAGGAHAHHGDRRVPRRRPTRGKFPHGAADGEGGARDEARSGRVAPAQLHPAERISVPHASRRYLRRRRLRAHARAGARRRGREQFPEKKKREQSERQAARPRAIGLSRVDRGDSHRDGRHRSRPQTERSPCSPARRRWGRGWKPPIRSLSTSCSESTLEKSGSCRATPTAPTASAASARARRSSAARRSSPPDAR